MNILSKNKFGLKKKSTEDAIYKLIRNMDKNMKILRFENSINFTTFLIKFYYRNWNIFTEKCSVKIR